VHADVACLYEAEDALGELRRAVLNEPAEMVMFDHDEVRGWLDTIGDRIRRVLGPVVP